MNSVYSKIDRVEFRARRNVFLHVQICRHAQPEEECIPSTLRRTFLHISRYLGPDLFFFVACEICSHPSISLYITPTRLVRPLVLSLSRERDRTVALTQEIFRATGCLLEGFSTCSIIVKKKPSCLTRWQQQQQYVSLRAS